MLLRAPLPEETEALLAIGSSSGLFSPGEVEELLGNTLAQLHAGELDAQHSVRVACDSASASILGWSHLARAEQLAGAFELLWVGVAPSARRAGVGSVLLAEAEREARAASAAWLRICTSTQPETAAARALYGARGYVLHGEPAIDYYEPGVHMLEYRKQL